MIETTTFELFPDVDALGYQALDDRIQADFSYQQPGIVRRTLARSDTEWLVETWWESHDQAIVAAERFTDHPLFAAHTSMVDQQSIRVSHYETV